MGAYWSQKAHFDWINYWYFRKTPLAEVGLHPAPTLGKYGLLNIPLFLGYAKSAFSMVTESNETGNESVTESNGARITLDSKTQSGQYGFLLSIQQPAVGSWINRQMCRPNAIELPDSHLAKRFFYVCISPSLTFFLVGRGSVGHCPAGIDLPVSYPLPFVCRPQRAGTLKRLMLNNRPNRKR